jgi:FMN-dependent dehydrogenase
LRGCWLRALPEVVAAVNGRAEVLMDGGIRRGADIVKAVCPGARAVLCGPAYTYGLAVSGEAGVTASSGNPAHRRRAHAPAAGVRFDRRVGSFVRERSSKLVSRLNAGRKTHSPRQTASATSEKQIASLQFENASHTNGFQTIRGTYTPDTTRQFDRNDGRLYTGGLRCAAINTRSGHETHSIWRTGGGEAGRAVGRSDPA